LIFPYSLSLEFPSISFSNPGKKLAGARVNPGESHPEQRGHGSSRESRGERCEDRKGFHRWGKSLSFKGTYPCPGITAIVSFRKNGGAPHISSFAKS